MLVFDILPSDAAGYQLINHAVQIFPIMVVGFFSVLILLIRRKDRQLEQNDVYKKRG